MKKWCFEISPEIYLAFTKAFKFNDPCYFSKKAQNKDIKVVVKYVRKVVQTEKYGIIILDQMVYGNSITIKTFTDRQEQSVEAFMKMEGVFCPRYKLDAQIYWDSQEMAISNHILPEFYSFFYSEK